MRRLVVFLLLLAIGVAVLAGIGGVGMRGGESMAPGGGAESAPAGEDTPLTAFSPKKGAIPEGVGISPIQRFEYIFDAPRARDGASRPGAKSGPPAELRVEVLRLARDGTGSLERPSFVLPSADGGPPEAEVTAERGRGVFSGNPPSPASGPWTLENASITYRGSKSSLGPLTLTTPKLSATIDDKDKKYVLSSFSTTEAYQIVGDRVRGSGVGFKFDVRDASYTFDKDPNFELRPGASPNLEERLHFHSKGTATVRDLPGSPGLVELKFRDDASFRAEPLSPGGANEASRYFEVDGQELQVLLARDPNAKETESFGSLRPRSFEAKGSVLFRGAPFEGRCAEATGDFVGDKLVSNATLTGPFRIDLRLAPSSRKVPGLGSPQSVVMSGEGEATARLVDEKQQMYEVVSSGSPRLDFVEPQNRNPPSIASGRMSAKYGKDGITEFHASGGVEIRGSYGTLRGETADVTSLDAKPSLVLGSASRAGAPLASIDLADFSPLARAGTPPVRGETPLVRPDIPTFTKLNLKGRTITFDGAGEKDGTRITAVADVEGTAVDADGGSLTFHSQRLETTVGKPDGRSVVLDGAVRASFEDRNLRLTGSHFSLDEKQASGGPLRNGLLTGAPALVEFLEQGEAARAVRSPKITIANDTITAEAPVEVTIPADSLAGSTPGKGGAAAKLTISGSRLDVALDAQGRPKTATLLGPLQCEAPYSIVGDRLVLDLRSGHHTLAASEGTRAVLARQRSPAGPGFRAEAPRIEVENDSQTFVMAGGGVFTIDGAPIDLGGLQPRDPNEKPTAGTIRFETTRDVRISPGRASFLGDVVASSEERGGWRLRSDRLDIDLDEARRPVRVTARGNVVFEVAGRLSGKAESLRFSETTQLLELDGAPGRPAELAMGHGSFVGSWLKCNLKTYLVESGPAEIRLAPQNPPSSPAGSR